MPDFGGASHLPSNRPDGLPADPRGLPRQRRGITPQMHGRYPDYDVLSQQGHWDDVTSKVVLGRVHEVPSIRFFTADEVPTIRALLDTVLAQDAEPRIPVVEMVDARLHARTFDGYRYAGMPDDAQTFRLVAQGLDEAAGRSFGQATEQERLDLCAAFSHGEISGATWKEIDAKTAWKVVMRYALAAFYSHPWSWNEIGFGGPAYPRGYARLGVGQSETWEAKPAYDIDPVSDVRERGLDH